MANPNHDKAGRFTSKGGSSKGAKGSKSTKSTVEQQDKKRLKDAVTATRKSYPKGSKANQQERDKMAKYAKSSRAAYRKAKNEPTKSFSKAERMRSTDAPRGRKGSKADRMADI